MTSRLERAANVVLTIAVLAIAGILIRDRFFPPPPTSSLTVRREKVRDWSDTKETVATIVEDRNRLAALNAMGVRRAGSQTVVPARTLAMDVTLITDYECPFCRAADSTVGALSRKYGPLIVRSVVHLPIRFHRQAVPAARALECSKAENATAEMNAVLFARQDSLGVMSWGRVADEAFIEDTVAFKRCIESTEHDERIRAGEAFARRVGVTGTPALILNGELIQPATPQIITAAIDSLIKGRRR